MHHRSGRRTGIHRSLGGLVGKMVVAAASKGLQSVRDCGLVLELVLTGDNSTPVIIQMGMIGRHRAMPWCVSWKRCLDGSGRQRGVILGSMGADEAM
jgi:hypothetical protein